MWTILVGIHFPHIHNLHYTKQEIFFLHVCGGVNIVLGVKISQEDQIVLRRLKSFWRLFSFWRLRPEVFNRFITGEHRSGVKNLYWPKPFVFIANFIKPGQKIYFIRVCNLLTNSTINNKGRQKNEFKKKHIFFYV